MKKTFDAMTSLEGHRAKKRFGQNFLVDEFWIEKLARAINAAPGDAIIEIGPGRAALTRKLIAAAGFVRAVEIDRDLAAWLQSEFPPQSLQLTEADALTLDWKAFVPADQKLRIVGNLPYNISSPLLFSLLPVADCVQDQHFMLQREVVDRMAADAGSKTYGRLSVMLQFRYKITKLFDVPAGAFRPIPAVTSAFVRMRPRPPEEIPDVDFSVFSDMVTRAFSQRRKTLRNALSAVLTESDIRSCGIDPGMRAEMISLPGFVQLTKRFTEKTSL